MLRCGPYTVRSWGRSGSRRTRPRRLAVITCGCLFLTLSACQGRTLPATPNLYAVPGASPFVDVPLVHRTADVEILYATDRGPIEGEGGGIAYGSQRSTSLAFGRCLVNIGGDLTWEDLVEASLDRRASVRVPIAVTATQELVRFPSSVSPLVLVEGQPAEDPAVGRARSEAEAAVLTAISQRLAASPHKEIFVFVHGIHNSFEDPMYRMAQLWHMMGRTGVPIVYTWPANPRLGPLLGYTHDRESGEFTVFHLREFLRLIAACPELERLHILAHSRGTDIAMTALRELHLQAQARGADTREELKLGNVVFAAPDLDLQVTLQRLRPDLVHLAASRFTFYVSEHDKAIGIAGWLFSSIQRLGRLRAEALNEGQRSALRMGVIDIIDARVSKLGAHGHTYFIDNPAVLSDLILVLRDSRPAGAEHGRPLIQDESGFWKLYDGYPHAGPHAGEGAATTPDE